MPFLHLSHMGLIERANVRIHQPMIVMTLDHAFTLMFLLDMLSAPKSGCKKELLKVPVKWYMGYGRLLHRLRDDIKIPGTFCHCICRIVAYGYLGSLLYNRDEKYPPDIGIEHVMSSYFMSWILKCWGFR